MNDAVLEKISLLLGEEIVVDHQVGGGCIADSHVVKTIKGHAYFLKKGYSNGMFSCEANGLQEISKSNCILTPKVLMVGDDYLLLEKITQGPKSREAFYKFGQRFAQMHKFSNSNFGFYEDNFIGATTQVNSYEDSWADFYIKNRLGYQFRLAKKNGYVSSEFNSKFLKIESKLSSILQGSEELPSLLHGDLWGGNYLINEEGEAVLIDPAVYYGHREADLAMTKLFGGFSPEFYKGYEDAFPLQAGSNFREKIYLLYHVLNHLNIFGRAYYSQAISLMDFYL